MLRMLMKKILNNMKDQMDIVSRVLEMIFKKSKENVRNQKHGNEECLQQLQTGLDTV